MSKIFLNGEAFDLAEMGTVQQLLQQLSLEQQRVAVEVNQTIVPRSQYSQHQLSGEDCVEIVAAIGGG